MRLVGGNAKGHVVGLDELPGHSNYFIGNDPKKWRSNVPSYRQVKFEGVYPGIDLVYYGNHRQLEYDFVVAPGADPTQVKLTFPGADGTRIDPASGDLVLKVGNDKVHLRKPAVYQPAITKTSVGSSLHAHEASFVTPHSSVTIRLDGTFVLANNNQIAFRVVGYDPKRALVIDPVLTYSTYLGGSSGDDGAGIAVDAAGNAYITGETSSTDFPTANPLQATCDSCSGGGSNAFVAKLNPAGSALIYSTYLGGNSSDSGAGIAVDSSGNAYVTGTTSSTNFPTVGPFQSHCGNCVPNDPSSFTAFVAKLNPAGSALVYSTYLGGSTEDAGYDIAVDAAGSAYVAGYTASTDFPTANPLQATCDSCSGGNSNAFVAKLNPTGSALVYSTYLGGTGDDGCSGLAVDASGNAYVAGYTSSTNFPTANALQPSYGGGIDDAFVTKLNPTGSAFVYSTYLGGSGEDVGFRIVVDTAGNTYVTGQTNSINFPTVNPFQGTCNSCGSGHVNVFVAKLNPAGSALVYSTYLSGTSDSYSYGYGIAVDVAGNDYITGGTGPGFPISNPLQPNYGGGVADAFVAMLNPTGSALVYSTYLGGSSWDYGQDIAVDAAGSTYVTGYSGSTNFPTVNPLQGTCGDCSGSGTTFVSKISPTPAVTLSTNSLSFASQSVGTTSAEQSVTLTNTGLGLLSKSDITVSADFTQTNTCGNWVNDETNCTINVTFSPTAAGPLAGTLTITDNSNGVAGSTQIVDLSGTGFEPVANSPAPPVIPQPAGTVEPGQPTPPSEPGSPLRVGPGRPIHSSLTTASPLPASTTISTAPAARFSSTSLVFTSQAVGTSSTAQTVTLSNFSETPLPISNISASGDFTQTNDCGTTLEPGAHCTISVTFKPGAAGKSASNLTFTSSNNGVVGGAPTVTLIGTGAQPVMRHPVENAPSPQP